METSLISVARCGKGSTAAIKSRHVDGRIAFDEARQLRSFRPHIADFQQEIPPEGVLNIQIPILRIRQTQIWTESQISQRSRERARWRRIAVKRISKIGDTDLRGLQIWRR